MNKFYLISLILKNNISINKLIKIIKLKKKLNLLKIFFKFNYENYIYINNFFNNYNYNVYNNYSLKKNFYIKIPNIQLNFKKDKILSSIKSILFNDIICELKNAIEYCISNELRKMQYIQISIPIIINYSNLLYSGQIPYFYNNLYKIENKKIFLIPTSEVILNSLSFFIKKKIFPVKMFCNSLCFRKEIGNLNKKTNGIKRQQQFTKIEFFRYFTKKFLFENFFEMCSQIIYFLNKVKIKFKLIKISNNNINKNCFLSYDFEIWSNIDYHWIELSSLSLCLDKPFNKYLKKKNIYNINGSYFPIGRFIYIIFEKYRISNNYIKIPKKIILFLIELLKR